MSSASRHSDASVKLVATLRLLQSADADWPKDDLPDLLDAQLSLPAPTGGALSCRETLLNPAALDDIVALKDTAKAWIDGNSAMPGEIGRILYISAIASAERSFSATISRLSPRELAWHRTWALSQNWADRDLLDVVREWQVES